MKEFSTSICLTEKKGIVINKDYEAFLRDIGLDSFEAAWDHRSGQVVKEVKQRSVIRLEAANNHVRKSFYLKLHKPEFIGLRGLLCRALGKKTISQGLLELNNICEFREKGLSTIIPVAAGEKFEGFFRIKSFLITQDCSPYVSLETLMDNQTDFFRGLHGEKRKKTLLRAIASLAERMHKKGFNHRDFNATHILLHYAGQSDAPDIALFDLQRIEKNKLFRLRWKIKSLARLNYTLPEDLFSKQDRINLLLFYKNKSRFNIFDRLEWFWIEKKTARIKRHTEKNH